MDIETEHNVLEVPDYEAPAAAEADASERLAETTKRADSPHPGTPAPSRAERARTVLRFAGPIVALVLGIKALVFSFGVVVGETIGERTYPQFSDRFSFWNIWDAPHYLSLARDGYQTVGDPANFIVFFPGYPYAVRVLNTVVPGDLLTAAFVVTGIASVTAALLLGYLVRHDTGGDETQGTRAVWFLLIFPTAYFLHIPYTESLFLSLVLGSFVAARTGHWGIAGVVGALAALTRLNGALLIPALAVEAYLQYRKTGRLDPAWAWIAFIGVGVLIYLGINQYHFGDPFQFQQAQSENWHKHLASPITSVSGMIEGMAGYKPGDRQLFVVQELLFLGIGLVATVLAVFLLRPSYAVWAFLNLPLFASTSWIQSTPRYVMTIFPIFMLLAMIKRHTWVAMLISAWSLMMMAWFTTLFATGRWAF